MHRLVFAIAVLVWLVAPASAQSTPPSTEPERGQAVAPVKLNPMQVVLVRSADPACEPACPEWIAAQGDIDASTVDRFRKVLKTIGGRRLPILIDSNGGTVDASFEIGRLIRAKGLDVAVSRTVLQPCQEGDEACRRAIASGRAIKGLAREQQSRCASSCAFVLAAGTRRYVGPRSVVGVHQIATFQTQWRVLRKYKVWVKSVLGVPVETRKQLVSEQKLSEKVVQLPTRDSTYTRIRSYFTQMGIDARIVPLLLEAPPTSLRVLTRTELLETRMATDLLDGETVIRAHAAAAQAGAAALSGAHASPLPGEASPGADVRPAIKGGVAGGHAGAEARAVQSGATRPGPTAAQGETAKAAAAERPPTAAKIRTGANADCMCPQLRSCRGGWESLSCESIRDLCRSADSATYARLNCGGVRQRIGF